MSRDWPDQASSQLAPRRPRRTGRAFPAGSDPVPGRLAVAASPEPEPRGRGASVCAGRRRAGLARGAGEHFGVGEVRQTIIELEQAFLFVTAAGHGSCLVAVLCSSSADAGLMAYEMAMLVKRAGPHLAAHPRFPAVQIQAE